MRKSLKWFVALVLLGAASPQVSSAAPRELPWGPATPLVRGASSFPHEFGDWLHRGDDGSMLVTVRTGRGIATAVRPPRGRFRVQRLIRTGPGTAIDDLRPRPLVAAGGRSLLLWQPAARSSRVAGAVVDPASGPRALRLPSLELDQLTGVAFGDAGDVTAVSSLYGDPLQVVTGRADGRPMRVQTLVPAEEGASLGHVASTRGAAAVAWRTPVPCAGGIAGLCLAVRAAVRPAGAKTFGPASTLDVVSPPARSQGADVSAPVVHAVGDRLLITWRLDDSRVHAVRAAAVSGSGFLPTRSVPGTERNSIVYPSGELPCASGTGATVTPGNNPRALGLLPRPGGGIALFLHREDAPCTARVELSTLSAAGEPTAPQPLPGLRSRANDPPRIEPGPDGHALIVSGEGRDLAFARLDATDAQVAVEDAEYVASGWDGHAAIVVARVSCGGRTQRTDAWVLTASGTRRARVWPCQRGQPPMELDGAGRLVLAGHLRKNLFVARASCRLAAWVARPRAACRAPRA